MSRAVIIAGGEILDKDGLVLLEGDTYICADCGTHNARLLRIEPDVVIGDFDSHEGDITETATQIIHPPEKDETDTALAAYYAADHGFENIEIWGGTGGRLDHTIANIFLLLDLLKKGIKAALCDGMNTARVTDKGISVLRGEGKYVSIFSLADRTEGVTISGAKYPLINYTLKIGDSIGVSNEVTDDSMDISFKSGMLLVITAKE